MYNYCFAEDANDTCDVKPVPWPVTLTSGCSVMVSSNNVTTIDVGKCVSEPCVLRDDKSRGHCCVSVLTEDVTVTCDGFTYPMRRVVSCGCGVCDTDGDVDVSGAVSVQKSVDGQMVVTRVNASLAVSGNDIDPNDTDTFSDGLFSFTATPEAGSIVIRFFQQPSEDFMPQIVSIDVPRGVSSISRQVVLQAKPDPVPLNASLGGVVRTSSTDGSPTVTVPPNSLAYANGTSYSGTVNVYPTFADPRSRRSISAAPGEFSFENAEGESQDLQTNGVIGLFFETEGGEPLQLSGKATLTLDADTLGIGKTDSGDPDSYAWTIDADTGKWRMAAPLKSVGRRRKRAVVSITIIIQIIIPYPLPYINLDKPALRRMRCTLIIQVYADLWYRQPLSGVSLQVVTMTTNGLIYIGYTMGYTNWKGRACVTVMCGFRHMIILKPVIGQPVAHRTHYLPPGFNFINLGGMVVSR